MLNGELYPQRLQTLIYLYLLTFLVQVRVRTEVLSTISSTQQEFKLMTSRSWQHIWCHWDACSNHSAFSDFRLFHKNFSPIIGTNFTSWHLYISSSYWILHTIVSVTCYPDKSHESFLTTIHHWRKSEICHPPFLIHPIQLHFNWTWQRFTTLGIPSHLSRRKPVSLQSTSTSSSVKHHSSRKFPGDLECGKGKISSEHSVYVK